MFVCLHTPPPFAVEDCEQIEVSHQFHHSGLFDVHFGGRLASLVFVREFSELINSGINTSDVLRKESDGGVSEGAGQLWGLKSEVSKNCDTLDFRPDTHLAGSNRRR